LSKQLLGTGKERLYHDRQRIQPRTPPIGDWECLSAPRRILLVFACLVSFTDSEGIRHAVNVTATSLYEAAVLAMAEFRRCEFAEALLGSATRLSVTVRAPATTHEITVGELNAWLKSGSKSPSAGHEEPLAGAS
jgi:hypothetical protein